LNKGEKLVEVYKAAGELEAQVIKGLLESYGIPCFLKSHAAPSGEVKVMVCDSMAEKAKQLVEGEEYA